MKRILLFFLSSLFLLIFNLPSVFACSGGPEIQPPTVDTMLGGEIIVRGRIIENSGGNSIIEVERYLQGSGSRYLLIYRQSPETYVSKVVRAYDFGCSYALSAWAEVGVRAYFWFSRGGSGIYNVSSYEEQNMFPIVNDDEGFFVHYGESLEGGDIEAQTATLAEFEAMIVERTNNPGTAPESSRMPRFRLLNIRTESGQVYQLPVDSYEIYPIEITDTACTENCPIVSPDGSHSLSPIPNENNAYWAWYYPNTDGSDWSQGIGEGEGLHYPPQIHAQSILFSPNSDYILAWYENSISLYAFNTWQDYGFYGQLPTLQEVWSAQLALSEAMTAESFRGLATWSSNSNVFVYWDVDGLKWMDVSMMRVPRLILPYEAESIQGFAQVDGELGFPPLLELSTTGRYLRYGQADEWMLLDVLTSAEYDDMLVSTDETQFISIAPEVPPYASIPFTEEVECIMFDLAGNCLMTNERHGDSCILPMATCSRSISLHDFHLRELHLRDNASIVYLVCESSASHLCYLKIDSFENPNYSSTPPERFQTNAFAYDEHYGYIAWATDDYHLRLSAATYGEPLDFSEILDSPIASLEWGEPLWYQGE